MSVANMHITGLASTAPGNHARVLMPHHLQDLRNSGLADDTIARCGFYSVQTPAAIIEILKWRGGGSKFGACLAIPFLDLHGKPTSYIRLKPDTPRKDAKTGKANKYESPKGSSNRAYIPPGTRQALLDPSIQLVITEGEKKAAKADQEGIATIGLVGVYGFQQRRNKDANGLPIGERQLIPDLAMVAWSGRKVFICYDSDAANNDKVKAAEFHLAETLRQQGALVYIVRLPACPDDKKVGLDDFLVANSAADFHQLMETAAEAAAPLKPLEAADDPHRLARLFDETHCRYDGKKTVRYFRADWHRFEQSCYRILPVEELRGELTAFTKLEMDRANIWAQQQAALNGTKPPPVRKVTGHLISDVMHALASLTILPGHIETPSWIDCLPMHPAKEYLACQNCLVHLPSLVANRNFLSSPTPTFFSPNALSFAFQPDAPAPQLWLNLMNDLWPNDEASIQTLQDWFGYCLTADTRLQKILMLIGPPRAGKGVIASALRGLIGEGNVAGPTLSSLAGNFGLAPLLGKTLAIIADARLGGRSDIAVIVERLLSISGEDAQTIDRKNQSAITTKLACKFMLMTNELPRLLDSSGAMIGRFILLRLRKSFAGLEDVTLTDRLLTELPGILSWAIQGWQRLQERRKFIQPEAGREMLSELAKLASPIQDFVEDRCRLGPGLEIEKSVLFEHWKSWCQEQGRDRTGNIATFGRDLLACYPAIGTSQPNVNGDRIRVYTGISI